MEYMVKEDNSEISNLVVETPSTLHRSFKSKAATDGLTIKEAIIYLMTQYAKGKIEIEKNA